MKIRNLMEDLVETKVNKLYDDLKRTDTPWLSCDCEDCRLDSIAFVLNRIPPKYIVSSRGITHTIAEGNLTQVTADIDTIAIEAIRLVNFSKRPTHNKNANAENYFADGKTPYFFFPTFSGTVLDGTTFEPLPNATVSLFQNENLVSMINKTWFNPTKTFPSTKGTYSFYIKPELANEADENKQFEFSLKIEAEGYEPISYGFSFSAKSEILQQPRSFSFNSLKIRDLFLFQKNIENPME